MMFCWAACLLVVGCSDDEGGGSSDPPPPPSSGDLQAQGEVYWWNDQVFYEVFVRSFYDSDGDGIGDLQGLIAKLDYLNDGNPETTTDLGVTALWLMPVMESPSYHGYDATDYRTVEPDYGTNADFQQLMAEAHARGIRVIVDYVMNHCSNQHPWFTASQCGRSRLARLVRLARRPIPAGPSPGAAVRSGTNAAAAATTTASSGAACPI